jgi:hypothetical protein
MSHSRLAEVRAATLHLTSLACVNGQAIEDVIKAYLVERNFRGLATFLGLASLQVEHREAILVGCTRSCRISSITVNTSPSSGMHLVGEGYVPITRLIALHPTLA